jgi:D-amino-acid dehydrogenase
MRIAIIGGGVVGLAQAYDLARHGGGRGSGGQGIEVTVIDQRTPGLGASSVNAGWVCPAEAAPVPAPGVIVQSMKWMLHRDSPLYIKPSLAPSHVRFMLGMWRRSNARDFRAGMAAQQALAAGTMEMLDEYTADGVKFEMHAEGLLLAYLSLDKLHHHAEHLDVPASFGMPAEILIGDDVRDREPALGEQVAGGIYFPTERHLDPAALVDGLRARCTELGVTFIEGERVTSVERRGDRVTALRTDTTRIPVDAVILATGAWSGRAARMFEAALPVRAGKGYAIDCAPPPVHLRSMINLSDAKVAVTPLTAKVRLAGTMEFGPHDETVNVVRVGAILRAPRQYFTAWPQDPPHVVAGGGMRPMTPDGLPIIGRLPGLGNAYVTTGHGMMGVTLAAGSARALSSLVLTGATPREILPFSARRFTRAAA